MFRNIHKHIPVTSLEGGSAQEVKIPLSGITDIRENASLAEPKFKPGPPLVPRHLRGKFHELLNSADSGTSS